MRRVHWLWYGVAFALSACGDEAEPNAPPSDQMSLPGTQSPNGMQPPPTTGQTPGDPAATAPQQPAGGDVQTPTTGGGAGENMFEPGADTWADPEIAGGGYALAQMSHSAGLAYWLTGLEAESVSALTTSPTSKVELYDSFSVRFKNGAIGSFSGAGALPDNQQFQLDVRVFGSEGVMTVDCDRARLEILRHDENNFDMKLEPDAGAYFGGGPTANFADIVSGKSATNWAPGWAGMRAIEMIDAAYRSVESGNTEPV